MTLKIAIVEELDSQDEIRGTEHMAYDVLGCSNKPWIRILLRQLQADGLVNILRSRGGRGHKTIYKRNRNSPGSPRKVRHE